MNLVIDNTVEVNGNEKNDIGMVVSVFLLFLSLLTCEASIWGDFPEGFPNWPVPNFIAGYQRE